MYYSHFPSPLCIDIEAGQMVSVFGDTHGKCKRGLIKPFEGDKVFVGNGQMRMSRKDLFATTEKVQ